MRSSVAVIGVAALIWGWPGAAFADEVKKPESVSPAAEKVEISKKDCQRLMATLPNSAEAAYKPGVDVYGRKVKSADVAGQMKIPIPKTITFDVEFEMKNYFGGAKLERGVVGKVKYDINSGGLTFNGKPLLSPDRAELATKCRDIFKGVK